MDRRTSVIAVLGRKASGKTTVIEGMIRGLTKGGYRLATAKHVHLKGFSMDTEGRDTWRHSAAGANPVASVSDAEIAILIKNGERGFSLDQLFRFLPEVEVVVLEGFSWLVLDDERVGKVLCVRNRQEYEAYRGRVKGEVIAFCSHQSMGRQVLGINKDSAALVRRVLKFVKRELKISKILEALPDLECKKCGFETCRDLAEAIYRKKARFSDCVPLKLRSRLKTKITVNDTEVPIQPFVSRVVRNSILGMVSSLKGVSIRGNEEVTVIIRST